MAIRSDIRIETQIVWLPLSENDGGSMGAGGGLVQKELLRGSGVELNTEKEQGENANIRGTLRTRKAWGCYGKTGLTLTGQPVSFSHGKETSESKHTSPGPDPAQSQEGVSGVV